MCHFASIFFIICTLWFNIQAQLDISYTDIEVPYYHPDYFKDIEVYLVDGNRLYGNFTIIKLLPDDLYFSLSIIGATMGEYIVPTGFDVLFPMCEIYKDPILAIPVLSALNFSTEVCPPLPGTYIVDDFEPDCNLYPDTFPPNNYLVKSSFHSEKELFFEMHVYQRIV